MARYRDAIQWLADNELNPFVADFDLFSDSIQLTAHLFGKEEHVVCSDALDRRSLDRRAAERQVRDEEEEEDRMMDDLA